jgi:transcriptional regulator with XRE-family HTH domain
MSPEYRNIYQIARESAGITQEKASELIDISVESIRAYESGKRIPPDTVVIKMIEIYGTQYLAYQHLKTSAEVGQKYLPNIDFKDLPSAILRLQKEVSDFLKCRDQLIEISCDGIISADELPQYKTIMKELDDIVAAILTLKFAKTN